MSADDPITLAHLPNRVRGRIVQVGDSNAVALADGLAPLEDLLLDLGFEEGATVEVRHRGLLGSPLAVRVDDRMIALRPADAAMVKVVIEPAPGSNPDVRT